MKNITLDFDNKKEVFLKGCTNKNKIQIVSFTSLQVDTFPQCVDLTWNYPDSNVRQSVLYPEISPYQKRPIVDVQEDVTFLLEDVQYLKLSLANKGNCIISFEEI